MSPRWFWVTRLIPVMVFAVGGVAFLTAGVVIGHGRFSSLFLIIVGAALILAAAMILFVRRRRAPTLSPSQRSNLLRYLKVRRYIRAGVEGAVGVALIVAGAVLLISGEPFAGFILGFGCLSCSVAGLNVWLARRLSLNRPPQSDQV